MFTDSRKWGALFGGALFGGALFGGALFGGRCFLNIPHSFNLASPTLKARKQN